MTFPAGSNTSNYMSKLVPYYQTHISSFASMAEAFISEFKEYENAAIISDMAAFRLCAKYKLEKPNERRALDLMNAAAIEVMRELPDITLEYVIRDEFRYIWQKPYESLATLMNLAASFSVDLVSFSKDVRGT